MRRSLALPFAAVALAAAALPASAGAASWSAPRAVGSAGRMSEPTVAADVRGRLAVGFVRQLRGDARAEVRTGTTRSGLRGPSIVLERSRHLVDSVVVGLPPSGADLAVAWRRLRTRALRLNAAAIAGGRTLRTQPLTLDGTESAYSPAFVAGLGGALRVVCSRRRLQAGAPLAGTAFGAPVQVAEPAQRAFVPRLAASPAGEVLVAWVNSTVSTGFGGGPGIVRVQRVAGDGQPVGPRLRVTPNGVRTTQDAIVSDGSSGAVVAWTRFRSRTGGPVQARRIAPGGIAGTVRTVSRGPVLAGFAPVLAGAAGRVAAAWVLGDDVRYSVFR